MVPLPMAVVARPYRAVPLMMARVIRLYPLVPRSTRRSSAPYVVDLVIMCLRCRLVEWPDAAKCLTTPLTAMAASVGLNRLLLSRSMWFVNCRLGAKAALMSSMWLFNLMLPRLALDSVKARTLVLQSIAGISCCLNLVPALLNSRRPLL